MYREIKTPAMTFLMKSMLEGYVQAQFNMFAVCVARLGFIVALC